ncbi:MAG TPA: GDSL-type esterase/lipase family protein [Streptosporangiaceae bacterium]|nr:GDSL-type esterase/lipase family protein [Streptosporangiaceae bacterium]
MLLTGGWARLARRWLAGLLLLILSAAAAIAVALQVTPLQRVVVAGQMIEVGASAPDLSLSGPGEVDLFGQALPTDQRFTGPVRPRLQLSQITINSELTTFVEGNHLAGAQRRLGASLASGWKSYFAWETVIAGAGALVLVGAVAGWRRHGLRSTLQLLAAGLVVTEAINLGAIMITAYSAPAVLRQVHSLSALVGSQSHPPPIRPAGRPLPGVQAVVMGDSTAAGAGLTPVPGASTSARACGRSADSYAADLSAADGWKVLNLACDGATITNGILGSQIHDGQRLPPQLAVEEQAKNAQVIIVSVGADDLDWAAQVRYCAIAAHCDDRATTAYFQQQLASFSKNYLDLLSRLAALPSHPQVLINRYYDPFGSQPGCLSQVGLTAANLATLTSRLNTLNDVLASGAAQFGFSAPQPDFAGHQMCTQQPYVQGVDAAAPFHPTVEGQLAIALADQAALHAPGATAPGA